MAKTKTSTSVFLRVIYTVFLALLISLFFGLGISAFYPRPKAPEYPLSLEKTTPMEEESAEFKAERDKYEQESKDYRTVEQTYNRNVSMISLGLAVLALMVSLLFLNRILIISDGLMLGGVFTLIYSIILGFSTEDVRYRFVLVSIGLLITLGLGYVKFIRHSLDEK